MNSCSTAQIAYCQARCQGTGCAGPRIRVNGPVAAMASMITTPARRITTAPEAGRVRPISRNEYGPRKLSHKIQKVASRLIAELKRPCGVQTAIIIRAKTTAISTQIHQPATRSRAAWVEFKLVAEGLEASQVWLTKVLDSRAISRIYITGGMRGFGTEDLSNRSSHRDPSLRTSNGERD